MGVISSEKSPEDLHIKEAIGCNWWDKDEQVNWKGYQEAFVKQDLQMELNIFVTVPVENEANDVKGKSSKEEVDPDRCLLRLHSKNI